MYTACLFCNGWLGSNESIEPFPVGRRLAFDIDKKASSRRSKPRGEAEEIAAIADNLFPLESVQTKFRQLIRRR